MSRYVVTGGAGFIGSHVVDYLVSRHHSVTVIDDLSTGSEKNLNSLAEFYNLDLVKIPSNELVSILKGASGVFHLAALPRIQPSFIDPIGHDDANVRMTLKLILAMKEAGVKDLVFSSSSAIYGTPNQVPTTENAAVAPLSPYALQKYTAEQYSLILGTSYGMRVVALRYFNPYGPRSFNPANPLNAYSSVIGIFAHAKKSGERLKVTGDGSQRRDFVHVSDVALANYQAMLHREVSGVFNVGTGEAHSINDIARLFADSWDYIQARSGEAAITHADISKIRLELGWSPQVTLEAAIRDGIV